MTINVFKAWKQKKFGLYPCLLWTKYIPWAIFGLFE